MRKPDTNTRLAITGVGIICSIGRNQSEVWRSIVEARAGIGKLTKFPGETFPTDVAAEVGDLDDLLPIDSREARRMSRSDLLAVIAANEAVTQANDGAFGAHVDVLETRKQRRDLGAAPARRIAGVVGAGRFRQHGSLLH